MQLTKFNGKLCHFGIIFAKMTQIHIMVCLLTEHYQPNNYLNYETKKKGVLP